MQIFHRVKNPFLGRKDADPTDPELGGQQNADQSLDTGDQKGADDLTAPDSRVKSCRSIESGWLETKQMHVKRIRILENKKTRVHFRVNI